MKKRSYIKNVFNIFPQKTFSKSLVLTLEDVAALQLLHRGPLAQPPAEEHQNDVLNHVYGRAASAESRSTERRDPRIQAPKRAPLLACTQRLPSALQHPKLHIGKRRPQRSRLGRGRNFPRRFAELRRCSSEERQRSGAVTGKLTDWLRSGALIFQLTQIEGRRPTPPHAGAHAQSCTTDYHSEGRCHVGTETKISTTNNIQTHVTHWNSAKKQTNKTFNVLNANLLKKVHKSVRVPKIFLKIENYYFNEKYLFFFFRTYNEFLFVLFLNIKSCTYIIRSGIEPHP